MLLSEDKTHLIINSSSPDSLRDVLREVDLLLPSPRPLLGSRVISISTDIVLVIDGIFQWVNDLIDDIDFKRG